MSEFGIRFDRPDGRLDILDVQGRSQPSLDLSGVGTKGPSMALSKEVDNDAYVVVYERPEVELGDGPEETADSERPPTQDNTSWHEQAKQQLGDKANQLTRLEVAEQWFGDEANRFNRGGRLSETEGMRIIEVHERPDMLPEELEIPIEHDNALKSLLGTDYPNALKTGVLSKFYMDGSYNAPLHVLVGELKKVGADTVLRGLHHAPSAAQYWSEKLSGDGDESREMRIYTDGSERMYPGDPYQASSVTLGNTPKTMEVYSRSGRNAVIARSTMFPEWFDAYTALKNTTIALENSDPDRSVARTIKRNGVEHERKVSWGVAPGLDGKSEIMYKLITIDGKIIAARPVLEESTPTFLGENDMMKMLLSGAGYTRGR